MDWSDKALTQLYVYESLGKGSIEANNGFALGKKMIDVALAQWKEDMYITLFPFELYEDPNLPDWWLDKVLGL